MPCSDRERVYHTGGYLRHGEVVWLLAKLPREIRGRGREPVETYLLFANSHDGSVAIDIRPTTVRVVCQNTLSMALNRQATGKVFRCAHGRSVERLQTLRQTRHEVEEIFRTGIPARKITPVGENLWGAVNAVTAWVDHQQRVDGDRYAHALLGSGDKLKTQALFQARSLCESASA
jgi:hypothetical protein